MKKLNTLLFLFIMLTSFGSLQAQERYLDEVFTDVTVTNDVTYGVNATVLFVGTLGEAVPQALQMDVYEPEGDTETNRPVIIYLVTGNFLPQPNFCSSGGWGRTDKPVVEIATRLAKRGYVVAVASYRLGWNPAASTQDERTFQLINAAYRGTQDARTCVRFFRKDAAEGDNQFGINPEAVTYWGQGTGGYVAFGAASIDTYADIASPPKFNIEVPGIGAVPMVLEGINGDVTGESVGIVDALGAMLLPFPEGDTLCYPNHVGYDSDVQLCVNMGGAVGDLSWINEGDPAFISYHVPNDSLAPYEEFTLTVPTTCDLIVEVQGSYLVQQKAAMLGLNDAFAGANFRDDFDPYTDRANSINDGYDGLFPFQYPEIPTPTTCFSTLTVTSPWEYWDAAEYSAVDCPLNPGVNMHLVGLSGNPNMSEANGMAYIDTMINYFVPRACLALGLGACEDIVSVDELTAADVQLKTAPNPSSNEIVFSTNTEFPIQNITILDVSGREVQNHLNINQNQHIIYKGDLNPGIYIATVQFEDGIVTSKLVFN